jgi:hypothetical protein
LNLQGLTPILGSDGFVGKDRDQKLKIKVEIIEASTPFMGPKASNRIR